MQCIESESNRQLGIDVARHEYATKRVLCIRMYVQLCNTCMQCRNPSPCLRSLLVVLERVCRCRGSWSRWDLDRRIAR